jgi:hypothetical protein
MSPEKSETKSAAKTIFFVNPDSSIGRLLIKIIRDRKINPMRCSQKTTTIGWTVYSLLRRRPSIPHRTAAITMNT